MGLTVLLLVRWGYVYIYMGIQPRNNETGFWSARIIKIDPATKWTIVGRHLLLIVVQWRWNSLQAQKWLVAWHAATGRMMFTGFCWFFWSCPLDSAWSSASASLESRWFFCKCLFAALWCTILFSETHSMLTPLGSKRNSASAHGRSLISSSEFWVFSLHPF